MNQNSKIYLFIKYISYICANFIRIMLQNIRLKRGLDIPIAGSAEPVIRKSIVPDIIAMKPTDFKCLTPKLCVKEGDAVKAGSIVFVDKKRPEIGFASPCSGTVLEIVRGEKRKLLAVLIKSDSETEHIDFGKKDVVRLSKEEIEKALLESGLWPVLVQRPYGIIADPATTPKAIYISGFNSAPLAPDYNFTLKDEAANLQTGVEALKKFTKGNIVVSLRESNYATSPLYKLKDVVYYAFEGPHPAGNVGVQINNINPLAKGDVVWTLNPVSLAAIGRLFNNGVYDVSRLVAVTGMRAKERGYIKTVPGISMKQIAEFADKSETELYNTPSRIRYISGDVLTGENVGEEGYLGFYDNQITLISEGNYHEFLGWAKIARPKKFSLSGSYFSWLTPKKKYDMDTNTNGGRRAFVVSGLYEKVLPMDIYPVYLLKAILAEDIDKMEQLGIYEVIEEDLALCEYVCPSKIDVQSIIAKGIDLMIKEMA